MTKLAHRLGLSPSLSFYDVYSLTDRDIIAFFPRPAYALLFVYPHNELSDAFDAKEKASGPDYDGFGSTEPVMFYRQTIVNACGLIGLLHCLTNGPAAALIDPESDLATMVKSMTPLRPTERAQFLHDSDILEQVHGAAAQMGDTVAPVLGEPPGQSFIAFVKGKDGHLYKLYGGPKGPIDLGLLDDEEDVLSERALDLGPLSYVRREEAAGSGVVTFSCTALGPTTEV
jgi:ubiquitin carboxyl-terminal hydrolase L3